jgi:hypothetical protein
MAEYCNPNGDETMHELLRVVAEVGGANLTTGLMGSDPVALERLERARSIAVTGQVAVVRCIQPPLFTGEA